MVLGDAKISTAQSVFGGSSGYFDGTGAYPTTSGTSFDLGTENWTIEFIYRSDTNNRGLFGSALFPDSQLDLVASKIKILAGTGTTRGQLMQQEQPLLHTGWAIILLLEMEEHLTIFKKWRSGIFTNCF